MKRKHGFLLFFTSCVPGCGQMHQGYMKRGLSLMLLFCAIFILAMFLNLDYLLIFFVPLWTFSFFDSWNLRNAAPETAVPDEYLFGLSAMDSEKLNALFRKRHSFVGWGLVLLGVYILFDTFASRILQAVCEYLGDWWLYDIVMRDLPRMVVTILIIALGVWFIRGPKQPAEDSIPTFTPPAAPEQEVQDGEA